MPIDIDKVCTQAERNLEDGIQRKKYKDLLFPVPVTEHAYLVQRSVTSRIVKSNMGKAWLSAREIVENVGWLRDLLILMFEMGRLYRQEELAKEIAIDYANRDKE